MTTLKRLAILTVVGALALAGTALALTGCSSDGTSSTLADVVNTIAGAVSDAVSNGSADSVVEQLVDAGVIDADTATAIEAVLPVAGTVASAVETATADSSDTASKDASAIQAQVAAVLWAHSGAIAPDKLPAALKSLKSK